MIASVICVSASLFYCIPNHKAVIAGGANLLLTIYFLVLIALQYSRWFLMGFNKYSLWDFSNRVYLYFCQAFKRKEH